MPECQDRTSRPALQARPGNEGCSCLNKKETNIQGFKLGLQLLKSLDHEEELPGACSKKLGHLVCGAAFRPMNLGATTTIWKGRLTKLKTTATDAPVVAAFSTAYNRAQLSATR